MNEGLIFQSFNHLAVCTTRQQKRTGRSDYGDNVINSCNYRLGTVKSNTVNSKFHFIRSFYEIFYCNFPITSCLKCAVNSSFHLIQSKFLPTNDFELTVPNLYIYSIRKAAYPSFTQSEHAPGDIWVSYMSSFFPELNPVRLDTRRSTWVRTFHTGNNLLDILDLKYM